VIKFIIVDDTKEDRDRIKILLNETVKQDKEILMFTKITPELKKEIQNTDCRKVYILDIELLLN